MLRSRWLSTFTVIGAILIVLSEWSDHSLRHEADAERLLGVPVLASLPEAADLRTPGSGRALAALTADGSSER